MRSGKNRVYKSDQQCELDIQGIKIRPGDAIIGDDNGVLVVPENYLQEVILKATNIKKTEQAIINAVSSGMSLVAARKKFRYDQPWLERS